jgi:HSP20 family protein
MRRRSIPPRPRGSGETAGPGPLSAQPHFRPPADVYANDSALIVRAELGGLPEGGFEVQLHENALVVEGERPFALGDGRHFYEVGIRSGPFRLEVPLPRPVEADLVDARYEAGILVVTLPWSPPT